MIRILMLGALALAACGSSRSTHASYPGAPAAFDKAASEPKAVEIAEKMYAAAGGPGNWEKTKQIRWKQIATADGKVAYQLEEAWDRWNARHHARLAQGGGQDIVVGYEVYGDKSMGYVQQGRKKQGLDDESRTKAVAKAKSAFNEHTGTLLVQFLVLEPGAKLAYVGPAKDDKNNENYDEIMLTFGDPARSNLEFHVIVDRTTNLPQRVEMLKTGTTEKVGFTLADWTTVNGLKIATSRTNLGYAAETTAIKDITVGGPEDELYIAPLDYQ
jgi:hypothetical protein